MLIDYAREFSSQSQLNYGILDSHGMSPRTNPTELFHMFRPPILFIIMLVSDVVSWRRTDGFLSLVDRPSLSFGSVKGGLPGSDVPVSTIGGLDGAVPILTTSGSVVVSSIPNSSSLSKSRSSSLQTLSRSFLPDVLPRLLVFLIGHPCG